jgi:hypothetical protein
VIIERKKRKGRLGAVTVMLLALLLFSSPPRMGFSAETDRDILANLRQIELTQMDYDREADPYFAYVPGTIPVLVSAPHGTKHYRAAEGRWRSEDAYTSSLAVELGRLTGAHVLYARNKAPEDANNDTDGAYKEFLERLVKEKGIKFILDLHGAEGDRPFNVDIGVRESAVAACSCPTYREIVAKTFSGFGSELFNQQFPASSEGTITSFARNKLGIEAAQIEINANYRIVESKTTGFKADPSHVLDMVKRLAALIRAIGQEAAGISPGS